MGDILNHVSLPFFWTSAEKNLTLDFLTDPSNPPFLSNVLETLKIADDGSTLTVPKSADNGGSEERIITAPRVPCHSAHPASLSGNNAVLPSMSLNLHWKTSLA